MTLDPDILLDRRRLKRRLALWRVVAIVALVAVVLVGYARYSGILNRDHVARYDIDGIILDDADVLAALEEIAEDSRAKALIVHIDSPGGTFVGGEQLYDVLRKVSAIKPVVTVMGTVAASAGYMAAVASDRIFAHQGTITGSIGVIMQTTDITRLLDNLGISAEAIKSSPLKATPSPLEPMTDEARAASQAIIDDMHGLFIEMVAEQRGFEISRVRALADGRVFTGRQAVANGLVDAIGGESEARDWLASKHDISKDLPILDVIIDYPAEDWFTNARILSQNMLLPERLTLDGLVSLWHPGGW
jgi:protease-4